MAELLEAGITVTIAGMGVVFVLLTLLVYVIQGMSALSRYLDGGQGAPPTAEPEPPANVLADDELVSVIAAAIRMHRSKRQS